MTPEQSEREAFDLWYASYNIGRDDLEGALRTAWQARAALQAPSAAEPVALVAKQSLEWLMSHPAGEMHVALFGPKDDRPSAERLAPLFAAAPAAKPLSDDDIRKLARAANLPKIMFDTEGFRDALRRFLAAAQGGGE